MNYASFDDIPAGELAAALEAASVLKRPPGPARNRWPIRPAW